MGARSRHFPDWIEEYLHVVSPNNEAPEKFHFWVAVSTIAGTLRRRVYIDQGTFKWFPNFFIVLVGEPGVVKKGTAIKTGLGLLRGIPGVNLGSDVATWQGFLKQLEASTDSYASGPVNGSLLTQRHITTNSMTIPITELGTFIDPRDYVMINMLTKLWDCEDEISLSKTTVTQGDITIVNPFVNLLSGTTPGWIRDNLRQQFAGWGLFSRIVFIYASQPAQIIAYPGRRQSRSQLEERLRPLASDLLAISRLQGTLTISPDAEAFATEWYGEGANGSILPGSHYERMLNIAAQPDHSGWLSDFLARKYDQIHKLAIILSVSRRSTLEITLVDMQDAVARADQIEAELRSIFNTSQQAVSRATRINHVAWSHLRQGLEANNRLAVAHAHRFLSRYMDYRGAGDLINQLTAMQYITMEQDIDGRWIVLGPAAPRDASL